jgi:hypothetical protein
MQRRRSTGNRLDHRGKERYKEEKNVIYKRREEGKPEQRGGEWRREKSKRSYCGRLNVYERLYKKLTCNR